MFQKVYSKNGISLRAKLVEVFPKGKLFYAQERLMITDNNNKEIKSLDVIELVTGIKDPFNHPENYIG